MFAIALTLLVLDIHVPEPAAVDCWPTMAPDPVWAMYFWFLDLPAELIASRWGSRARVPVGVRQVKD